jgi:hypothetical protein
MDQNDTLNSNLILNFQGTNPMAKEKIRNPEMGDSGKSWNVVTGCDRLG